MSRRNPKVAAAYSAELEQQLIAEYREEYLATLAAIREKRKDHRHLHGLQMRYRGRLAREAGLTYEEALHAVRRLEHASLTSR
jgi:hypothetical protein